MFDKAHEFFENRRWKDALNEFDKLLKLFPKDRPSLFYTEFCRKYLQKPPHDDWDGVFVFKEK